MTHVIKGFTQFGGKNWITGSIPLRNSFSHKHYKHLHLLSHSENIVIRLIGFDFVFYLVSLLVEIDRA